MKNIFINAIVLSLTFLSCKKDDDTSNLNISSSIVGTWQVDKVFIKGTDATNECDPLGSVEFMNNGRFENRFYVRIAKSAADPFECEVFPHSGKYFIDKNNLRQVFDDGSRDLITDFLIEADTLKYINQGNFSFVFVKK